MWKQKQKGVQESKCAKFTDVCVIATSPDDSDAATETDIYVTHSITLLNTHYPLTVTVV